MNDEITMLLASNAIKHNCSWFHGGFSHGQSISAMEPGWRSTGARHPRQLGARVPGRQSDPPWEAPGTSAVTGIQNMGKMDGRFMEKLWFHPTSDRKVWENLGVAPKLYGTMVVLTNKSLGKLMKHIWDISTNIWHLSNHGWTWSQPTIEVKNPDLTIAMCRDPIRIIASAKVKQLACLLLCLSMFIHPLVNIQIAIKKMA